MFFLTIYNIDLFNDTDKTKILKIIGCGLILYLFLYLLSLSNFGSKIAPLQYIKLYLIYLFFLDICGVLILNRINRFNNKNDKNNLINKFNYKKEFINRPNTIPIYKETKKPNVKINTGLQTKPIKKVKSKQKTIELDDSQSSVFIQIYKNDKQENKEDIDIPIYKSKDK